MADEITQQTNESPANDPVIVPHFTRIMRESDEARAERTIQTATGQQIAAPAVQENSFPLGGALFRQNPIPSLLSSEVLRERILPTDETPVSTDQIIANINRDQLWGYEDHFLSVRTAGQYNAMRNDIERERADREVLADYSGFVTVPAGLAIGMMDPTSWVPLKKAFDLARAGGAIRATLGGAAIMGGYGLAMEPALQASQQLRTWQEGVESVGAQAILGGVLGVAPAAARAAGPFAQRLINDFRNFMYSPNWNEVAFNRATQAWNMINEEIRTAPAGPVRRVAVQAPPTPTPAGTRLEFGTEVHGGTTYQSVAILRGTDRIGSILFKEDAAAHQFIVDTTHVPDAANRRQGFASTMYEGLIREAGERGYTLRSSRNTNTLTDNLYRVGLRSRGYNVTESGGVFTVTPKARPTVSQRIASVGQRREQGQAFDALTAAYDRLEAWNESSAFGWRAPWDSEWGPGRRGPAEVMRTMPQRLLGRVLGPGWQDPFDFIMRQAATVEGKKALQQVAEVVQLLNGNVEQGRGHSGAAAAGQNVPTLQSFQSEIAAYHGGWATFYNEMWGGSLTELGQRLVGRGETLYTQARRAGFAGGTEEFDRAVFRAVVNGHVDPTGNPAVTRAAERYKALVSDPIRDMANKLGYNIPETPRFALGHAPRQWVIGNILGPDGQGRRFLDMVRRAYFNDLVTQEAERRATAGIAGPIPPQLIGRGVSGPGGSLWVKAGRMANQAFENLTQSNVRDGGFRMLDRNSIPGSMFRERVIPIADDYLVRNGWIDGRITDLSNYQIRTVTPQLLLGGRFRTAPTPEFPQGRPDPTMEHTAIAAIEREYNQLGNPQTTPGTPAGTPSAVSNADERQALMREKRNVIQILRNVRDGAVYGSGFTNERDEWRRVERLIFMTKTFQAMRLMGNLVINSVSDVGNLVLRDGLGRSLQVMTNDMTRAGIFDNSRFAGVDKQVLRDEATRWGAAIEWSSMSAMAARTDQLSPFMMGNVTRTERVMAEVSRAFSIGNLSLTWNDMVRTAAFRAGMDRILTAVNKGWDNLIDAERRDMVNLGIGRGELNRIGAAWRGQTEALNDGFLWFAHMSSWDDEGARRLMVSALEKDNASTVVRTKSGDFNTVAKNNPVVGLILQFQNFLFSHSTRVVSLAEQRLIADGFVGRDSLRVYAGLMTFVGLGMLSTYLLAAARDWAQPNPEGRKPRTEELLGNHGQWLSLGVERSSAVGMFSQFNMIWERMGLPGVQAGLQTLFQDESKTLVDPARQRAMEAGRFRTMISTFGGPTAAQAADVTDSLFGMGRHFTAGAPWRRSDARTLTEAMPFQNHLIARKYIFEPSKKWIAQDLMGLYDR